MIIKKVMLLSCLLACSLAGVRAQTMYVNTNGTTVLYPVTTIRSITFSNSNSLMMVNKTAGSSDIYSLSNINYVNFSTSPTAVIPSSNSSELTLYPNPVTGDQFTVAYELINEGTVQIEVFRVDGTSIIQSTEQGQAGNNKTSINMYGYPAGAYICRITSNGTNDTRKIIKY